MRTLILTCANGLDLIKLDKPDRNLAELLRLRYAAKQQSLLLH
jgi:hypothetical protein